VKVGRGWGGAAAAGGIAGVVAGGVVGGLIADGTDAGSLAEWFGAVGTVGALVYAARQLDLARLTRAETERPFVVVQLDAQGSFLHLALRNFGPALARNVRVTFDPPLTSKSNSKIGTSVLFADGMPTLAPGEVVRTFFDSLISRKPDDHAEVFDATVAYEGSDGRVFTDRMRLDLGVYREISYIVRHDLHDIHAELLKMRTAMARWSPGLGSGIHVRTDADIERSNAEALARLDEDDRRWAEAQGNVAGRPEGSDGGGSE
jgi:hypothetical protein